MSLTPAKITFKIRRGATFRKSLTLYQGATTTSDEWDLTGFTAEMVIKDAPGGDILITLTEVDGITLGGDTGTIEMVLDAATTDALPWDVAHYELKITAGLGGDTDTLLYGSLTVSGG